MSDTRVSSIDFRSFEPYYAQLKRILLRDLEDNFKEGHLLPSEAELCAQYSISRTVVRQALADLERDGLVLKIKGKGTFVTGRKMDTGFIQDTLGFYESMVRSGHTVQSRILKMAIEPAGVELARVLEIGVGEDVVQFDRVRSVDGRPVQVVRAAMPARLFPGLADIDMTDRSLYEVFRDTYQVRPASGHRSIEAEALSKREAGLLGVRQGTPGLKMYSITRSADDVVFEHFIAHYRGDSFRFELEIGSR
jgi:GntR family transcriptional regulator